MGIKPSAQSLATSSNSVNGSCDDEYIIVISSRLHRTSTKNNASLQKQSRKAARPARLSLVMLTEVTVPYGEQGSQHASQQTAAHMPKASPGYQLGRGTGDEATHAGLVWHLNKMV